MPHTPTGRALSCPFAGWHMRSRHRALEPLPCLHRAAVPHLLDCAARAGLSRGLEEVSVVIVSFDMTNVAPQKRVRFSKTLAARGWEKPYKTKTTFRWSQKNPVTAISAFMDLLGELGLKKHITHLVVHMIRD